MCTAHHLNGTLKIDLTTQPSSIGPPLGYQKIFACFTQWKSNFINNEITQKHGNEVHFESIKPTGNINYWNQLSFHADIKRLGIVTVSGE